MTMQRLQNGQAVARRSKLSAAPRSVSGKARPAGGRLLTWLRRGDEGQAIVETAFVLPMLLMLFTGIFIFAVVMYKQILLRTAASQGVQVLALSQNVPNLADPCTLATTTINQATGLNSSLINITFYEGPVGGTVLTAGSNCANIQQGTQLTVYLTYPCSFAFVYNFNHICSLSVAESEPAQ